MRGLLAAAGIGARVFNEYAGGALGELPFPEVAPSVWIEEARDVLRARQIIASFEQSTFVSGTARCDTCGEESPHDFAICWQCQRQL